MNEESTSRHPVERRSEKRKLTDQYHSVEFPVKGLETVYQFKIWDISQTGLCMLVREDSNLLEHLEVGDILEMKYYPTEARNPMALLKTEIRHISRDPKGRFQGHFLVGLSVLDKRQPDDAAALS